MDGKRESPVTFYHFRVRENSMLERWLQNKTSRYFVMLFIFIMLYKAGQYIYAWMAGSTLLHNPIMQLYDLLSRIITTITVAFYSLFYSSISIDSSYVIYINHCPVIRMLDGCTGLMPLFQILFILILFPMHLKAKLRFAPISFLIIGSAAIFHYLILVPAAYVSPKNFILFHDIISRVIFYVFFFINFVIWNRSLEQEAENNSVIPFNPDK